MITRIRGFAVVDAKVVVVVRVVTAELVDVIVVVDGNIEVVVVVERMADVVGSVGE